MSYYYLKEDNPFYGSKGNRMPEIIYSRLPSKHKELFSNKKIEDSSAETGKISNATGVKIENYRSYALNGFNDDNNHMNINFAEIDPFEGIMVPFDDDDENYEDDYYEDNEEGW